MITVATIALFVAGGLAVVPVGLLFCALIAWLRRAILYPCPPVSVPTMLRLCVREVIAQLRILGWTLRRAGASLRDAAPPPPGETDAISEGHGVPVVLLHGLMADGSSMWHLRRVLHRLGRPTTSPHLGGMLRPLTSYAARLTKVLEQHPNVDVVCHSLGGIVLRVCLAAHPELCARIRRVVTIASPHEGTLAAHFVPIPEARSVRPGCSFLTSLPSLRTLLPDAAVTTIASRHDLVVYPHENSRVDGADTHELDEIGHAELLMDPRSTHVVVEALR